MSQCGGFCRTIEFCFCEYQATQCTFEQINAEGRHAMTSLREYFRRQFRKHPKLVLREIHGRDEPLGSNDPGRELLSKLEDLTLTIALLPQAAARSLRCSGL